MIEKTGMGKIKVTKVREFLGHQASIYGMDRDDNGHIFSGSGDGKVVKWSPLLSDQGELIFQVNSPVYSVRYLRREQLLLVGTQDGRIFCIEVNTLGLQWTVNPARGSIFDIQEFQDGGWMLASSGGYVALWKGENFVRETQLSERSARVISLKENKVAVGMSDGTVRVLSLDLKEFESLQSHENSVFALQFDKNSDRLFSGGRDARLRTYDISSLAWQPAVKAHLLHINWLSQSPDGRYLISASMDKTLKLWNAENLELLKVMEKEKDLGHDSSVNKVLWIDAKHFISCGDDRKLILFSLEYIENNS